MAPKRAELKVQARHIRDTLGPLVSNNSNLPHLDQWTRDSLRLFLHSLLDPTPPLVTYADIQFSHIEKAMFEIQLWSQEPELTQLASRIIEVWDELFAAQGGVTNGVSRYVWGKGNVLEGCKRVRDVDERWIWTALVSKDWRTVGNMGLDVGQWWVHPICVYRDGLVASVKEWASCDESKAYAIVLGQDMQKKDEEGDVVVKWFACGFPKEVNALGNNLRMREPVRVFRRAGLLHKDAPACGIRYDGLYTIGTWGMGPRREDGRQEWKIILRREDSQPGMAVARKHPICEETDIHHVFGAMRKQLRQEEKYDKASEKSEAGVDGADEGYVSARSSALQDMGKAVLHALRSIV